MQQLITRLLCLAGMFLFLPVVAFGENVSPPEEAPPAQTIMGYIESVKVFPGGLKMKAKLDSGAHTSSIRAQILDNFTKDGKEWIRFSIQDNQGNREEIEKVVKRWVKIKKKEGGFLRRPVVVMHFCVGGLMLKGETNLATRENFIYPVLIGRNMMEERILIDVSKHFTIKPRCEEK